MASGLSCAAGRGEAPAQGPGSCAKDLDISVTIFCILDDGNKMKTLLCVLLGT